MSLKIFSYYNKRDLLYKVNRVNVYNDILVTNFYVYHKINNKVFSSLTPLIILFDKFPYITRLTKTVDKKLINTFVYSSLKLNQIDFINFLLRLKLINLNLIESNIRNDYYHFKINSNLFDEFIYYYQKYSTFFDIFLKFSFENCKNLKEKQLIINNLNNII